MASTITDIAKLAGVSHGTVSRVLNNAPIRVSKEKRQQILDAAKQLNYVPNQSAKALKRGKHNTISILAYDITDAFAVECASAAEKIITDTPYRLMWTSCSYSEKKKIESIDLLNEIAQFSDGIIIIAATNHYLKDSDILKFWANTRIPIITVLRSVAGGIISSVTIHEEYGAGMLLEHLIDLGHRKIAFCRASKQNESAYKRYTIYLDTLKKYHINVNPDFQVEVDGSAQNGYEAGLSLLQKSDVPTAVIGFNDLTGIGLIKACYEQKLIVPDNISIASFDNIRLSEMTTSPLTTVAANFTEMVSHALDELIERIENPPVKDRAANHYVSMPRLIIRKSTAKPKETSLR